MAKFFKSWRDAKTWQQILIATILGVIVGIFLRDVYYTDSHGVQVYYISYLKPVGTIFIHLIKMLVAPLIFASITASVISMKNSGRMGYLGIKTIAIYFTTTIFAATTGLAVAHYSGIGNDLDKEKVIVGSTTKAASIYSSSESMSIVDTIINIVPTNPAGALADGNALQIIIFAIFLGIAINLAGNKGKHLADGIESLAEVMYKLTEMIMQFAPYGIFALVAVLIGTEDFAVMKSAIKLVGVSYLMYFAYIIVIYGFMVRFIAKLGFFKFIKKISVAQLVAYSTSSSAAALPTTMKVVKDKIGVSKSTANFVLPFGTTVNMDGTSMTIGIYTIFLAAVYGISLSFTDYLVIGFLASLVSIGVAGIPSASLVMLSLILTQVGIPLEGIAIILAFDRILDMARTLVNVTGDAVVATLVDKSEGTFDQKKFDSK